MGSSLIDTEFPTVQVPVDPTVAPDGTAVLLSADNSVEGRPPGVENNITIYRYPQELGADVQYPHYLMFYVNAREDSAVATARGGRTGTVGDQTDQNRIDPDHAAAAAGVAVGASLAFAGARQGAKTLADQLTGKVPLSARVSANVIGGAIGLVSGAVVGGVLGATYGALTSQALVKIKDVVALHINNPPSVAYKANWSESDMGYVGAVGSGRIGDDPLHNMQGGMDLLVRAAASGLPKTAGGPNVRDVAEAVSRRVANPYKEQLFKSMGMRSFGFDYTFLPKSANEAGNVLNILRIFKRNMHPEIDKSKLFLLYPSEFSIVYYYKNVENQYINKISSCVLTDMRVRFGDDRDFMTFRGGFPTMINMQLQFLELEMLTGERVDNDVTYSGTNYGF